MISAQKGDPHQRLLEAFLTLAIDDVRYRNPTACSDDEYEAVKISAENLFSTRFYEEICEFFGIPAKRAAEKILSQKDTLDRRDAKDELPEM